MSEPTTKKTIESGCIKVTSDGSIHGTRITVDGKPVDVISVKFTHGPADLPKAVIEVYVDEVDIEVGAP